MIKSRRSRASGSIPACDFFRKFIARVLPCRAIAVAIFTAALLHLFSGPPAISDEAASPNAFPPVVQEAPAVATGDAFKAGDTAASSFAGTKLISDSLQPGVDPLSKTFIDPNGIVLRVYSVPNCGAPNTPLNAPAILQVQAHDIGHVFAVVFDNLAANGTATPGLFAAATSAFGLQIVGPDQDGDGKPDRLTKGAPGATFMDGQFGSLPGAGPGTIYKVDRASGNVTVFANIATGGVGNPGPGIGGLALDPASRTLFASDLDTGLIHAFASDGLDVAQFDHGVKVDLSATRLRSPMMERGWTSRPPHLIHQTRRRGGLPNPSDGSMRSRSTMGDFTTRSPTDRKSGPWGSMQAAKFAADPRFRNRHPSSSSISGHGYRVRQ